LAYIFGFVLPQDTGFTPAYYPGIIFVFSGGPFFIPGSDKKKKSGFHKKPAHGSRAFPSCCKRIHPVILCGDPAFPAGFLGEVLSGQRSATFIFNEEKRIKFPREKRISAG
jgi:hypothetical protein